MSLQTCTRCKSEKDPKEFLNAKGKALKLCQTCMEKQSAGSKKDDPKPEASKPAEYGKRPKRTALANRKVMDFDKKDPNYEYYAFVDKPGRIPTAEAAGWEVDTSGGSLSGGQLGRAGMPGSATTTPAGGGRNHVLMRKRKDEYAEDRKIYDDRATAVEDAILNKAGTNDNFYEKQTIKTKVNTGLHNGPKPGD